MSLSVHSSGSPEVRKKRHRGLSLGALRGSVMLNNSAQRDWLRLQDKREDAAG